MQVHRSDQFARWVEDLAARAKAGDQQANKVARHAYDPLTYLKNLDAEPTEDSATIQRVRQSRTHQVWRLFHPYDPDAATVVVTLFGADKAAMGDVFYDSVGSRADQEIALWIRANEGRR